VWIELMELIGDDLHQRYIFFFLLLNGEKR